MQTDPEGRRRAVRRSTCLGALSEGVGCGARGAVVSAVHVVHFWKGFKEVEKQNQISILGRSLGVLWATLQPGLFFLLSSNPSSK